MHLSALLVDIGTNPDRHRPGRQWLGNLYRVHQRLCMAFPSDPRRLEDQHFLKPYRPEDFGNGQVHVERKPDAGFLFRVDPRSDGAVVILVQSAIKPDWGYAFHNAEYLLASDPDVKSYDPSFEPGDRLRFRLLANPTRKVDTAKKEERERLSAEEWKSRSGRHGKRVPVPTDELLDWLGRRCESFGFTLEEAATTIQPGSVYVNKAGTGQGKRLCSARYDGVLTVTDPARIKATLCEGIGPAKAFGFGLLSVAKTFA